MRPAPLRLFVVVWRGGSWRVGELFVLRVGLGLRAGVSAPPRRLSFPTTSKGGLFKHPINLAGERSPAGWRFSGCSSLSFHTRCCRRRCCCCCCCYCCAALFRLGAPLLVVQEPRSQGSQASEPAAHRAGPGRDPEDRRLWLRPTSRAGLDGGDHLWLAPLHGEQRSRFPPAAALWSAQARRGKWIVVLSLAFPRRLPVQLSRVKTDGKRSRGSSF